MKMIYKYPLGPVHHDSIFEVEMPKGAKILDIQIQNGEPMIWAIVNTKHSLRKRVFHVFGTGHEMEDYEKKHYEHVKTIQTNNEWMNFVWHIFEVHE